MCPTTSAQSHSSSPGDIVIVGAGLAGLFAALKLAPLPVTVIAAAPLGKGASSAWAQGGIAAAVSANDSCEAHLRDTLAAGAGIVDEAIARLATEEAPQRIGDLLRFGVPFDRDLAGHFVLSQEAAHSQKRVVRVAGDGAGRAIMQALIASVRATPSIRVLEGFEAFDLCKDPDQSIEGVLLRTTNAADSTIGDTARSSSSDQALFRLAGSAVVLATGGIGYLYALTTNPPYACGDAIAMAARAGAIIADAEFVQFHPTAMDVGFDPAPLATEALRGEGAILVNSAGKRFMASQHKDGELGPRDIVARGVFREIKAGRGAYLDCREAIGCRFANDYPAVYQRCCDAGIDPVHEIIPVAPAQHYHMGGIFTDAHGRTNVARLWACGEVTSTGLHGANRLASNSLLEAVVFAARVADDIKATFNSRNIQSAALTPLSKPADCAETETGATPSNFSEVIAQLRHIMQTHVGVERNGDGLTQALKTIIGLQQRAKSDIKLSNMTLAARFITTAALVRKESRGGHFRTDYPDTDEALARRSYLTLTDLDRMAAEDGLGQ